MVINLLESTIFDRHCQNVLNLGLINNLIFHIEVNQSKQFQKI